MKYSRAQLIKMIETANNETGMDIVAKFRKASPSDSAAIVTHVAHLVNGIHMDLKTLRIALADLPSDKFDYLVDIKERSDDDTILTGLLFDIIANMALEIAKREAA